MKKRTKRLISLISSMVFISIVFFVVLKAGIENIIIANEEEKVVEVLTEEVKEDFLTVLVAVTDEDDIRTDALALVSVDANNGNINILNIPRDTLSDATKESKKINAAYVLGIDHTMEKVSEIVGFMPDKYVVCDLDELLTITELLGGVTIDIPINMYYDDPMQDLHIYFSKGEQTLYGEDIIKYLRFRQNNDNTGYPDGDLGRIRALQDFVDAAKSQVFTLKNVLNIPEIAGIVFESVDTNLSVAEILFILKNSAEALAIESHMIPGEVTHNGSYYEINEEETILLINEKFNPTNKQISELEIYEME